MATRPKEKIRAPTLAAAENRRQLKSMERRRRVLAAANRCFGRFGFRKTSVDLIAREADVSKALVFAFFGDKDGLYEAVIEHTLTSWTGFAEHQAARFHDRPDQELESLYRGSFEFVTHSPMIRVLMNRRDRDIQERGRSLPRVVRDWRARFAEVLQRGITQGVFRPDVDCRMTARVLHDIQHFYLEQMLDPGPDGFDSAKMEAALDLLLRGLIAKPRKATKKK